MDAIRFLSFYLSIIAVISRYILSLFQNIRQFPGVLGTLTDSIISFYFRFLCHLSPCTIDLDDQTTMHYWISSHRKFDKPNLVLIHGYGGDSRWQFLRQVGPFSRNFNLYLPDLLFFGKSYTKQKYRTDEFQARSVGEGLKRLGVERFSIHAISYGGYVGYRMADMYREMVEKVVIVSSGIGCTEEQKVELLGKLGRNLMDLLLPEKPEELRQMINLSIHKFDPFKWVPDFVLQDLINLMNKNYKKERQELVQHLMERKPDSDLPILTQETLLIWGDKDSVFPLFLAQQLQRHLGPKSRLEIIKDTGHAANIESPDSVNELTISFVLSG